MFENKEAFVQEYERKFVAINGKPLGEGTALEQYEALVALLREYILLNTVDHEQKIGEPLKQVYYFSMEFMIGRLLRYYLTNLQVDQVVRQGLQGLGIRLEDLLEQEREPGLGNGGLGRLAACYLDSMAFLRINGHGNGIRYRYGLFEQKLENGQQKERVDNWLAEGYPWETKKSSKSVIVRFKGQVRTEMADGRLIIHHENYEPILAVPYDVPIVGYKSMPTVNTLRLWDAEPVVEEMDLEAFNQGDYTRANSYRAQVDAISSVLYPQDTSYAGRELRLKQQYFFVAAGLASIVRRYKNKSGAPIEQLHRHVAVHINDTHPALCVPELMRILMDEEGLPWDTAWQVTTQTISYTNHTIMAEALEKWPIDIFSYLLPRIYQIVEEINRRLMRRLDEHPEFDQDARREMAILWDGQVHMANLAVVGSHSVNGVSALHSQILKDRVFSRFAALYPQRFNNKTNGVAHRRFLLQSNPALAGLITEAIGDGWVERPYELEKLQSLAGDSAFLEQLGRVKRQNKQALADYLAKNRGVSLDADSVFDVQVKRMHAYKRQLLNALKIMALYDRLCEDPHCELPPLTFIFGGKAAPGYAYAKSVIQLICALAAKIDADARMQGRLKVHFLENFNLTLGERVYPACEISEQISTAGMEASGTGNMKFMFNGAITLGTLDGANVEILKAVGAENCRIFGLKAEQVQALQQPGAYQSWQLYNSQPQLKRTVDHLVDGFFPGAGESFRELYRSLLDYNDSYFVLADFADYLQAAQQLALFYKDQAAFLRCSLHNIAHAGIFTSDRSVAQYADGIWQIGRRPLEYPAD